MFWYKTSKVDTEYEVFNFLEDFLNILFLYGVGCVRNRTSIFTSFRLKESRVSRVSNN